MWPSKMSKKTSAPPTVKTSYPVHREIRRRSNVVGIFPGKASYIRLITSYLMEYEEDWQSGRTYISVQSLTEQKLKLEEVA